MKEWIAMPWSSGLMSMISQASRWNALLVLLEVKSDRMSISARAARIRRRISVGRLVTRTMIGVKLRLLNRTPSIAKTMTF
jgi:hypothetical protein